MSPRATWTPYKKTRAICSFYLNQEKEWGRVTSSYWDGPTLDYVSYMEGEPVLRGWFKHHLKETCPKLRVRACTSSPYAVLNLILNRVGAGILPGHMILGKALERKLVRLEGGGKPLLSSIYVASLDYRAVSPLAKALGEKIRQSL